MDYGGSVIGEVFRRDRPHATQEKSAILMPEKGRSPERRFVGPVVRARSEKTAAVSSPVAGPSVVY